jgi:hypothetical protein
LGRGDWGSWNLVCFVGEGVDIWYVHKIKHILLNDNNCKLHQQICGYFEHQNQIQFYSAKNNYKQLILYNSIFISKKIFKLFTNHFIIIKYCTLNEFASFSSFDEKTHP